jgi:shikimate 5-dehydrogenase
MISGKTTLIAHIGYPTEASKASLVYNPWFDQRGIDAVVVPMGVKAEDYPVVMKSLFKLTNIRGALITMPHKVTTVGLLDEVTTTVKIAGACNAILKRADGLAARLRQHYPTLVVHTGSNDPAGYDLVVNGTPLGMRPGDPLPVDVTRLAPSTFVGEVVMKTEITPLLQAARERGCRFQIGTDMLFEMIPAYLEFFGFGTTTAEELRAVAKVAY